MENSDASTTTPIRRGGAAGNRNRSIKRLELRKPGIQAREITRNYVTRPADTPNVLMASTRIKEC
jgi:hypothetical protein